MTSIHPKLKAYLATAIKHNASDLHLQPNTKPHIRIDHSLAAVGKEILTPDFVNELILSSLDEKQQKVLIEEYEVDYALTIPEVGRFRVNAYTAQGNYESVIRVVAPAPRSASELQLPIVIEELALKSSGLVLVAGSTGSGKSSTLASMVDVINCREFKKIVTIENPVEILHTNKKSIITQREIGLDTNSFSSALRGALRQDPNVIMVGEIRDKETADAAIQAAQTGHLVLSTIHAGSAEEAIIRITNLFPLGDRENVRETIASVLKGIVVQKLLTDVTKKRVPACEVLINTARVTSILTGDSKEPLERAMQEGSIYKMQTLDQHLVKLVVDKKITLAVALSAANNEQATRTDLKNMGIIK